jgi:3-deoxy-D-manno-octulosonic-acid transferase
MPLDLLPVMRGFLETLRPYTLIIGETEIWPNLVTAAGSVGCRIVLLNGRLSDKSYPRYRLVRSLVADVLRRFDLLLMRRPKDADRIIRLGAVPERVMVAGNTKFDILPGPLEEGRRRRIRRLLGARPGQPVIALGSARDGESRVVMDALARRVAAPSPLLVVAPRHLGTVPQVEQACGEAGLACVTIEDLDGGRPPGSSGVAVVIVAEMGRLLEVYSVADVAVVGGTFRPFGGHNPLEPASQGAVTVVGPHIHNIEDDIGYLSSRECAFISDEAGLGDLIERILADPSVRSEMGRRAVRAVEERKGISRKCVRIMMENQLLPGEG